MTFNPNGGTTVTASKAVTRGDSYGTLPTPTRTGYTFAGWYTATSGGSGITEFSIYSLADDQTLYARWTAKKSALTFTANGGSGTMTTGLSATYGSAMPTPIALPTRTGYTFTGFYDATSGGKQYYTSAGASARSWNKDTTSGTTLYAHWTAKQSALTFNANGGSGTMTTGLSATYGSAMPTPINLPTRAGYTFAGFYDATSGGTKYYNANGTSATTWNKNTTSGTTLYARWTANSYTVAFDKNGGTGSMSSQSFTYDVSQALTANSFTRTGYTFAGWNRNADGTGTSYSDKQSVSNLTTTSGGTVTLYAKWTANKYTVTFKANGGPGSDTTKEVTYGSQYGSLPTPTYGGNTFNGWYTAATGGSKVTSTTTVATAQNHNLYAHWTANEYTVTLDKQSGTGGTSSVTATYGSAMPTATMPTRTGYTFQGYYDATSGGTQYYKADGTSARTWNKTAATTLYARWTGNTYYVAFDANGGTGAMSNETFTYDIAKALTANSFTRTGYTFAGWATSASGAKVYNDKQSVSNLTATSGATVTLYAQWTAKTYTLTLDPKGGTYKDKTTAHTIPNASQTTKPTYAKSYYWRVGAATRTGYTFKGWYTAETGGKQVYNANGEAMKGDYWSASGNTATWIYNGNVTVYAQWTANTYTITLDKQSGTGGTDSVTATFGSAMPTATMPTRTGYTFQGYYDATSGGTKYYNADGTSAKTWDKTGAQTLYARWTANTYKVTLDSQGGTDGSASVTATYGSSMPAIQVPTRNGYTFGGYYDQTNGGGTQYYNADGSSAKAWDKAAATTLYAKWTEKKYTITFNANGGEGGTCQELEYGAAIEAPTVTREGYTFSGWQPSVPTTVSGPATYEAQWTVNKYTITFDANGGKGGSSIEMDYGADIVAPTVTREGYTFSGWQPAVPNTVPASNATYVAQWIADLRFTITFEVEGGEFTDPVTNSVNTVYTNGCAYGWLPMATKANHEFAGWWTSQEPTSRVQQLATDTATNAISKLYARWKQTPPTVTVTGYGTSTNVVWGTEFGDLGLVPSTVPDGKYFAWWCVDGKPISDDYVVTNNMTVTPRCSVADILRGEVAFETSEWTYVNGGFRSKSMAEESDESRSLIARLRYAGTISFDYAALLTHTEDSRAKLVLKSDGNTAIIFASGEICGRTNGVANGAFEWTISGKWANSIDDYAAISNIQYSIATSEWVDAWCSTNSGARTLKLVTPAEAGVLSFNWRVNGETGYVDTNGVYRLCDRLSFRELGGTSLRVEGFSEENGFTHVCVTNENASSHVFVWRYEKDYDCDAGDNAAWIKDIVWTPLAPSAGDTVIEYTSLDGTEMTVSIPNSWIDDRKLRTGEMSYIDAVSGISATSGLPYWVGYIIGEDPDAEFRITDFAVHAGTISIGWAPNRSDRVYTIWGKTNLTDTAWHTPTNSATRFFTVEVSMSK